MSATWDDAQAYCGWIGGRLPTEAEWEYAARGGSAGARYGKLDDIAWYSQNSAVRPHDVGLKRPNGFGMYDVLGDVWEWVNDWYAPNYYQNSPSQDPTGPASGQVRVLRGGSFVGDSSYDRVSSRGRNDPTYRVGFVGFRCVRETVVTGQETNVQATLADMAGSILVQTSAGAEVFLDDSSKGTAGQSGQLMIPDVADGNHTLRVSLAGKRDYDKSVTVSAGQVTSVQATLADLGPPPGTLRENAKDGLRYVWIPPGTFMMGCSPGEYCLPFEKPMHQITISKGFWLGQTPVTVAAYRRYSGSMDKPMPTAPDFNSGWNDQDMPIVNVSWGESVSYCTWAGGRLPTEAEWEYAARAGSTESRYGPIDDVAWYSNNSGGQTHVVAQKRANGFGLFDMLGNVYEWVNDWYDPNYYQNSSSQDPTGPSIGQDHVLRGGSWVTSIRGVVRVSDRYGTPPSGPTSRGSVVSGKFSPP